MRRCAQPCGRTLIPSSAKGGRRRGSAPGRLRRGGGAGHGTLGRSHAASRRARARVQAQRGAQGEGASTACRVRSAAMCGCMAVGGRRIPAGARAAPGARALLPAGPGMAQSRGWRCSCHRPPGRVCARETPGCAGVRLLLHPGQRRWPGRVPAEEQRGGCSKGRWEVGVAHRVPRRPQRLPPEACAPGDEATRRRQSLPRGTRALGGMAESQTRRRMVPRPGTVWKRDRGWASCGCAVGRRKRARACSLCA